MNCGHIIEQLLAERANLNLGKIGVEIECLLRRDLFNSDELNKILYATRFMNSTDSSIEQTPGTKDQRYVKFETNNYVPEFYVDLMPQLAKLLGWMKRSITPDQLARYKGSDPYYRDYKEWYSKNSHWPNCKIPTNPSAGTHIHFDIKGWFSDRDHAERFAHAFNTHGNTFKQMVPRARYATPGKGGNFYAQFNPVQPKTQRGAQTSTTATAYFGSVAQDRRSALNCTAAMRRGDIEFRFINATLNYNTIDNWIKVLAELIEASRQDQHHDFMGYLDKENPESAEFVRQKQAAMAKSTEDPNFEWPEKQV